MRKTNKSEEVQMTSNVGRTFLTRPRVSFDDLLEEGVPQEHIDLVLGAGEIAGECAGRRVAIRTTGAGRL